MAELFCLGVVVISVAPLWLLVQYGKRNKDKAYRPGPGEPLTTKQMMFWDFFFDDDELRERYHDNTD